MSVKVLYYDIRGSLFAIQMDDMYFYVASDHVGTPQAVLSSGLSVIKELTTAPYGEIISDSNPAFTIPIGFWGGIHDPVSKLVFIDGRPYDPVIGRWMSPDQKWEEVAADPQLANRYRFQKSNPVNKDRGGGRYLSDLESWMKVFGYDTAVVRTPVAPTPHATPADPTSLRLSSGLACSLTACGIALERYSSVPKSKVTERMHADFAPARLSAGSVFGDGILLSVADGVVVVNALPGAHKQARDVAMVILNGTLPVGLQLTIQGMDSHFLVKPPGKQVAEDLWKLSMSGDWLPLGNGMNVTKHEIGGDGGGSGGGEASYIDVRLQGAQSVINVRYGTTLAAETQRVRNYAKQWAITQAWAREQSLLHSGHFGSYHWTEAEKREILQTGAAADYSGHYLRDVGMYPQLADDCNNIVFRKRPPLDNMLSGVL
ncbi:PREDICTED: teneurin-4-like [Priapulus caudatus]|uniref:Teneurin-4-like n=1 Tax=Priapulus caudatus TaxID=37621 RepID=A0ABM1EPH5_PRICU|nr:PREDICTED: teneurin-4-like [Priapulus caudatus]